MLSLLVCSSGILFFYTMWRNRQLARTRLARSGGSATAANATNNRAAVGNNAVPAAIPMQPMRRAYQPADEESQSEVSVSRNVLLPSAAARSDQAEE